MLREDLSHADADARLGTDSAYTAGVESFLRTLDPSLDHLIAPPAAPLVAPASRR